MRFANRQVEAPVTSFQEVLTRTRHGPPMPSKLAHPAWILGGPPVAIPAHGQLAETTSGPEQKLSLRLTPLPLSARVAYAVVVFSR